MSDQTTDLSIPNLEDQFHEAHVAAKRAALPNERLIDLGRRVAGIYQSGVRGNTSSKPERRRLREGHLKAIGALATLVFQTDDQFRELLAGPSQESKED